MADKALIIIPTYNEALNIQTLIGEIGKHLPYANILIVDDNSPDGTAKVVEGIMVKNKKVDILKREGKLGLASAYITGFRYALDKGYDFVFEMDGDLSHDPQYLPQFIEKAKDADIVLGSRYVEGGGVEDWPWTRKLVSKGGSLYARTILSISIKDLTGGYKLFSRKALTTLPLSEVRSEGYSFQIEMTYRASRMGLSIKETPIVFKDRTLGKSKMSWKIFIEAMFRVWQMRFTI